MLRNQQEHLREVSDERKAEIQTVSNALEAVTDNLRRMRTSIDRAGDELEMHEPIGSDVNAIKRLQDELKVSRRTTTNILYSSSSSLFHRLKHVLKLSLNMLAYIC